MHVTHTTTEPVIELPQPSEVVSHLQNTGVSIPKDGSKPDYFSLVADSLHPKEQSENRNFAMRWGDRLFYNLYYFLNPPNITPIHPYYAVIPWVREHHDDEPPKSFEQQKQSILDQPHSLACVGYCKEHMSEFENKEDRLRMVKQQFEDALSGQRKLDQESEYRNYAIFWLCQEEVEECWKNGGYGQNYADEETGNLQTFKRFDELHIKNTHALDEHRTRWDEMSILSRFHSVCPPTYVLVTATGVTLAACVFFALEGGCD